MTAQRVRAEARRFRGEPAVELTAGLLSAIFLPGLGMTGVSLRHCGGEHLALPGGIAGLRAGRTTGLPLLAPWANRLSARTYRAAGVAVDLDGMPLDRRRQRPAHPRAARRQARVVGRPTHDPG